MSVPVPVRDSAVTVRTDTGESGIGPSWLGRATRPDRLDIASDRGELFLIWKERWEDYTLLSGLQTAEPRVQMAALRSCLTDETIRVLRNLELSDSERLDVKASISALEKYANGQVNEVLERKRFNERVQGDGENFDDFLTSLRELSRSCNFCTTCNDSLIRDRIVTGLSSTETVKSLCAIPNLSLAAAITVCRAQEAASRDTMELRTATPASACQVRSRERSREGQLDFCTACARHRHQRNQPCPAWGKRCHMCQGLNHFSSVCQSRRISRDRNWRRYPSRGRYRSPSPGRDRHPPQERRQSTSPDHRQSPVPNRMYSTSRRGNQVRFSPPVRSAENRDFRPRTSAIIASTSVGGAPKVQLIVEANQSATIQALPDTGADISVAGLRLLDAMGEYRENLLPPEQHPKAANGDLITPIGILPVRLTLGNISVMEDVHILHGVTDLLLSWRVTRGLHIIPADYPEQIHQIAFAGVATGDTDGVTDSVQTRKSTHRGASASSPSSGLVKTGHVNRPLNWSHDAAAPVDAAAASAGSGPAVAAPTRSAVGSLTPSFSPMTAPPKLESPFQYIDVAPTPVKENNGAVFKLQTASHISADNQESVMAVRTEDHDNHKTPDPQQPSLLTEDYLESDLTAVSTNMGKHNGSEMESSLAPGCPDIIKEFPTVFDGRIRCMPGEEFTIHLKEDAKPFCVTAPRRVPLSLREPLKKELQRLQEEGIITPVTAPTEWCAPIVVAPKKDNAGIRLCVDLSRLNKYVQRELYQSPTPLEEVASITASQACWFTVFDAAKGYHQCKLSSTSQPLTTFITPFGRYAFLRAPYGVTSISEHYNRRMDEAFAGLPGYRKVVDDVIIYSKTLEEHIQHVRTFMARCQERGISLNVKKLQLARKSVKFAGFIVSNEGYRPDPQLTSSLARFPTPRNITELRSFFGLVNQLTPFVDDVAELLLPLRPLLSTKNVFRWEEHHQLAFEAAKKALTSVPTLAFFDPSRPTTLATDASRTKGIGFLLRQLQPDGTWRVIQAGSRFISAAEANYAVIELEALAVAWGIKKCHLFLSGLPSFQVITDHRPLVPILNSKTLDEIENPRLQRLKLKMGEVGSFTAVWTPGSQHLAADALSRHPIDKAGADDECGEDPATPSLNAIVSSELQANHTDIRLEEIRSVVAVDPEMQLLIEVIRNGFPNSKSEIPEAIRQYWPVHDRLSEENGLILCGQRVVIPSSLRRETLTSLHNAHLGKEKTKARARQVVYWPRIDADIDRTTRGCERCQKELPSQQKETMIQHEPASRPFQYLDVDLADHAGGKYLVAVDGYSGWLFVENVGRHANTNKVISALLRIFCQVGIPEVIWSDGGPQFTSFQFKSFVKDWSILHCVSSPYYAKSNGRAESAVKSAKKMLRRCWDVRRGTIDEQAWSRAVIQHRNTPGSSGRSPAQIVFGGSIRDSLPAHPLSYVTPPAPDISLEQHRAETKRRYDAHARDLPEFTVGTHVRVQDVRTRRWERCGIVIAVGPFRRYRVRLDNGGEIERNRCHLRRRYGHAEPDEVPVSHSAHSAGLRPKSHVAVDGPVGLRRSSRVRRPPKRLIEEM